MQPIEGAVIAAAGLGSRLGLGLPKCMLEIGGRTILSRLIEATEPHVRRLHVVVGYREELVIEHCSRHHRNVVLVRNPHFRTTNTAQSMSVGARGFSGKVLFLDGDLLISPVCMAAFCSAAATSDVLIGLTRQQSEHGVYVRAAEGQTPDQVIVEEFARAPVRPLEWANLFTGPARVLDAAGGFVFEELSRLLPLPGQVVSVAEIDTPGDLEVARRFGSALGG